MLCPSGWVLPKIPAGFVAPPRTKFGSVIPDDVPLMNPEGYVYPTPIAPNPYPVPGLNPPSPPVPEPVPNPNPAPVPNPEG